MQDALYLGIEIGGTKLQIVLGEGTGHIRRRWRKSVDRSRGGEGIRATIEAVWREIQSESIAVRGIGVGFGGPVDWENGEIACSHQIDGWAGFNLRKWLRELTQLPVVIDNDANVASLGEAMAGAGCGSNPSFYITMGSGVGGGLALNGRIYHGARPGEAEIGHVRLDRNGATVESRCSGWALDARIRQLNQVHPDSPLACLSKGAQGGEARHLPEAWKQHDPVAHQLLKEFSEDLAFGLSHVIHLFHPEVIILGGGVSLAGEPLRQAIAAALPAFTMKAFAPGPKVMLAKLGEDSVPTGALILAETQTVPNLAS